MNKSGKTQRLLACFGEPSRFRVVTALLSGERCVSDLAGMVGLSQSCTTRHLQALVREGLVRGKREGKRVMFRVCLEEPRIAEIVQWAASPSRRPAPVRSHTRSAERRAPNGPSAGRPRPGPGPEVPLAPPAFDIESAGDTRLVDPAPRAVERAEGEESLDRATAAAETETETESESETPSRVLRRGDLDDYLL